MYHIPNHEIPADLKAGGFRLQRVGPSIVKKQLLWGFGAFWGIEALWVHGA